MTDFVWFYGTTAVGKETLIRNIAQDPVHPLITQLELIPPLYIHEEAMQLRHKERADLVNRVAREKDLGRTILIKAQGYDMYNLFPIKLMELLPEDRHLAVFLDAIVDTIRQRRMQRGQQSLDWDDAGDRNANLELALKVEAAGMDFVWLDNNGEVPVETTRPEV